MGKITGFMEFERQEEGYRPVPERLKNYKEFVVGLTDEQAGIQGARCMDCGTPFCNSGCPGQQHHSRLQRPGVPAGLAQRLDRAGLDQQFSRVHRPHLSGAVRGGMHAECQR